VKLFPVLASITKKNNQEERTENIVREQARQLSGNKPERKINDRNSQWQNQLFQPLFSFMGSTKMSFLLDKILVVS
jgi:hypothetical protein